MGIFDRQLRQRKKNDDKLFDETLQRMAATVSGRQTEARTYDRLTNANEAVSAILEYYRCKPAEIPISIRDVEEHLEYALRPHGIMYRMVELKDDWFNTSFGPLIAVRKQDGRLVPLFPKAYRGYYFFDSFGKKISVNRSNAPEFETMARCFYRALPRHSLGTKDLLAFNRNCLNAADFTLLIVLSVLVVLFGTLIPGITKILTGFVLDSGNLSFLWGTAVFMLVAAISQQVITAAREVSVNRISIKTGVLLESAVMMRLLNLPAAFFRKYSSGELSSRVQSIRRMSDLLVNNVISLGLLALVSLIYLIQIARFAPSLVLPSLCIVLAILAVICITCHFQMKVTKRQLEYDAKENGSSFAMISGVQKIKVAGAEKRAFSVWAEKYEKSAALQYDPPAFLKINKAVAAGVSLAGTIVLYYAAVKTKVSPSDYIAFNAAYGLMLGAFINLSDVVLDISCIRPLFDLAKPILEENPEVSEDRDIVTGVSGGIELNNVCFRYEDSAQWIIDGLDLKIRPGEYLAIVGKTGCGKSTLVRLLLGFEVPETGAVYYDGKETGDLDLRSLRRRIGVVTQDGSLFQGSIYSNIAISAPALTMDEAWEAAETAGIADDIRAMPMGMYTHVSENGGGISGGQKQRIMIARAIAPKPKILIFDEATSALDNKTQKQVSDALDQLKCTRIVIAHRLSTIKNCDRILYLENGRIAESGTYEELLGKRGLFCELVERQRLND